MKKSSENKQVVLTGFHRSGTSLLAQHLSRAGLFLGEKLMGASLSNQEGHYEDLEFYRLHEAMLAARRTDWQYAGEKVLSSPMEHEQREILRLTEYRDRHHKQWGFKDPRSSLFLPAWNRVLSHPVFVVVYRHYHACTHSLLERAAQNLLAGIRREDTRFWREPELAYRMWLAYNHALLRFVETHPDRTLLISHEALTQGYPIVERLVEQYGIDLDSSVDSPYNPSLTTQRGYDAPAPEGALYDALEGCWAQLQTLSDAPAKTSLSSESTLFCADLESLKRQISPALSPETPDPVAEIFGILESAQEPPGEDLLGKLRQNLPLIINTYNETPLIRLLEEWTENAEDPTEIWRLLGDLHRKCGNEAEAEQCDMLLMASAPQVYPWHYARIAEGYLAFYRQNRAKSFIDKALRFNPENPQFYLVLAQWARQNFDYNEALRALQICREKAPAGSHPHLMAWIQICEIHAILRETEKAAEAASSIHALEEDYGELPGWVTIKLAEYLGESNQNAAGEKRSPEEEWKASVLSHLRSLPFPPMLEYLLRSIPEPLMRNDLIGRLSRQFQRIDPRSSPTGSAVMKSTPKASPRQANFSSPVCIVVLGMHRSGTSCLMGSLEHYGLYAGENSKWNPHNLKGNREHPEIVELNDAVLAYNGGSWDHPPEQLEWDEALCRRRDTILRNFLEAKRSPFGFKDPRTLLTFSFWKEGIEALGIELRLIGSFRHPEAVVASLCKRNPDFDPTDAEKLWRTYNSRLLEIYRTDPFPLLSFDREATHYMQELQKLAGTLGLHEHASEPFYDESLRHNRGGVDDLPLDAESLTCYKRLRQTAERNWLFLRKKKLTVIVNFYNMRREAERTLYTLSEKYQKVSSDLYDVVAIDNGSSSPLDPARVRSFGENFFYLDFAPQHPSPVEVLNLCIRSIQSEYVMCLIDGARMLSPSILRLSMEAWKIAERPFVYTLGMHLGKQLQNLLMEQGYDQRAEDRLLERVSWRENGYELFTIASLADSSKHGYFSPLAESNCFSMRREDLLRIGAFHERFTSPGGGLVNLDLFNRINKDEEITPIELLGEATFHQFHGGVATNVPMKDHPFQKMAKEYEEIYGEKFSTYRRDPLYFGRVQLKYHAPFLLSSSESNQKTPSAPETTSLEKCRISFVVDRAPKFYYQAELLLHSLERFNKISREQILVHCVEGVEDSFLSFLEERGYPFTLIPPYLDGKYCNKLLQLDSFTNEREADGVLLLDTDLFFLESLTLPDKNSFSAKIVDNANVTLSMLEKIFREAKLSLPETVDADFVREDNRTLKTYFNGGFYYIPRSHIASLAQEWKRWGEWLYPKRKNLIPGGAELHVDQVSMSLALQSLKIPLRLLPSNFNLPTHRAFSLRHMASQEPLAALHYHDGLNRFGLLDDAAPDNPRIREALQQANRAIAEMPRSRFYSSFREASLRSPKVPEDFEAIEKALSELRASLPEKLRILLHGGTSKTGTTSLQFFLHENREELKKQGVLYARRDDSSYAPKHQWMVQTLRRGEPMEFLNFFRQAVEEVDESTHTLILSSEGIYNHWWDFPPESLAFLWSFAFHFDTTFWIWLREPASFAESLYRQNLKNPRLEHIPCYGRDLSLDQMLKDPWFSAHLDYLGFLMEAERIFGQERLRIFGMERDVVEQACEALGIPPIETSIPKRNEKLSCTLVEALRVFNRRSLSFREKSALVEELYRIDERFKEAWDQSTPCNGDFSSIRLLVSRQGEILQERYGITFSIDQKKKEE